MLYLNRLWVSNEATFLKLLHISIAKSLFGIFCSLFSLIKRKTAEDAKNAEEEERVASSLCGYQIFIFVYMNVADLKQRLKDTRQALSPPTS
ncbi:MAG: hypothetical protein LBS86_06050 [Treponema sp.]|jgi:hypothetical protein|nr:hypothetical protein [Treponema sp.]